MRELEPLIDDAISSIKTVEAERRGRTPVLSLKQKSILLLLKHLFSKSNREMSSMLVVFSLLSGVDVSYKTVERLYSDEEVLLVLYNIHSLLLKKKGMKDPDCSGDGTGYSITVKKHYATEIEKFKDDAKNAEKRKCGMFIYSFALMDLDSRMYIGYGTSLKSEKGAFLNAVEMVVENVNSLRLDKYYSGQKYVDFFKERFGDDVAVYVIPKKNATVRGSLKWKQTLHHFANDAMGYLGEYFKRNQSESGFSEDKRRFGWSIAQRREDRINTAFSCTALWHNLLWLSD